MGVLNNCARPGCGDPFVLHSVGMLNGAQVHACDRAGCKCPDYMVGDAADIGPAIERAGSTLAAVVAELRPAGVKAIGVDVGSPDGDRTAVAIINADSSVDVLSDEDAARIIAAMEDDESRQVAGFIGPEGDILDEDRHAIDGALGPTCVKFGEDCHLCGDFMPGGDTDGHGLGECVEVCGSCGGGGCVACGDSGGGKRIHPADDELVAAIDDATAIIRQAHEERAKLEAERDEADFREVNIRKPGVKGHDFCTHRAAERYARKAGQAAYMAARGEVDQSKDVYGKLIDEMRGQILADLGNAIEKTGQVFEDMKSAINTLADATAELNAELERYKYAQSWRGKLARLWAWVCFPLIG